MLILLISVTCIFRRVKSGVKARRLISPLQFFKQFTLHQKVQRTPHYTVLIPLLVAVALCDRMGVCMLFVPTGQ